jgi:hypothetical protein
MSNDERVEFVLDVAAEYGIKVGNVYDIIKIYEEKFGDFSMNYENLVEILKEGNYDKV